ncbi:ras guanine nucleotide exchange factor i-related [Anaeramoeba flamelloides]|uniref:Ras guanine nucleotide exchange factor i-related n=1 Tax=Anaeramoeba flamelloides TaxID=1746091 RepID=A0ABQ8Y4J6_9EUKA|nr:ras guanine nucleotide exchange factor i-related [Anaeramoeba flamelloides]
MSNTNNLKTKNKKVGDKIIINGKPGVIKFIGKTNFGEGDWVGCELNEPEGNNNGTIEGTKYFECKPKHGVFIPFLNSSSSKEDLIYDPNNTKNDKKKDKKKEKQKEKKQLDDLETTLIEKLIQKKLALANLTRENKISLQKHKTLKKSLKKKQINSNKLIQHTKNEKEINKLESKKQELEKGYQERLNKTKESQKTLEQLKQSILQNSVEFLNNQLKELSVEDKKLNNQIQVEKKETLNLQANLEQIEKKEQQLKKSLLSEKEEVQKVYATRTEEFQETEKEKKEMLKYFSSQGSNFSENIFELEDQVNLLNKQLQLNKKKIAQLIHANQVQKEKKTEISKESKNKKSQWVARLMNSRPHLLELREKVRPILKTKSLGRLRTTEKVLNRNILNSDDILQIILHHYQMEGKKQLSNFIIEQTSIPYTYQEQPESILVMLLRMAIKEDNRLWDLTLESENLQVGENEEIDVGRNIVLTLGDNDLNIWDESKDNPKNIQINEELLENYNNGEFLNSIHLANVNKLIEHLIHPVHYDEEFIRAFLMTYHDFLKPEHLFLKVLQRYHVRPPTEKEKDEENNKIKREYQIFKIGIQRNVLNFLETWVNDQSSDFGPVLFNALRSFLENELKRDWPKEIQILQQQIKKGKISKNLKKNNRIIQNNSISPDPIIPKTLFSVNFKLDDVKELEFARQLTLYLHDLYQKIQSSELINQAWSKNHLKHKAPNVIKMIDKFNDCSIYIAEKIVSPETIKQRASQFVRWIKIGEYLREMNNFDSLLMVIAGLHNSSCKRLKHTQEEVSKIHMKTFSSLQETLSNEQGYKRYRDILANCKPPALPYVGLFLTDLTFISDGSPSTIDGLINFSKRKLLHNVIREIKKFQQHQYNFCYVYQIQALLKEKLTEHTEKSLYKVSLENEPRGVSRNDLN